MKKIIKKTLESFGYKISRLDKPQKANANLVNDTVSSRLPDFIYNFKKIPGMVPTERAILLYMLAYASSGIKGDIVEIGSWQGRTTCFLAQACKDAGNGIVHAIDTFKGNPGKEAHYVVSKKDLGDLKNNFISNIRSNNLEDYIKIYPMKSSDARTKINTKIRMLFIDGDHGYKSVAEDIKNYSDLLCSGGITVLDDYSYNFPGVIQAVKELIIDSKKFANYVQDHNTFIAKKR